MRGNLFRGAAVIAALSLAAPPLASAQTTEPTVQPEATTFSAEHLDALLAPVALYPDALLVQVLMASTFPLQVVEASRWLERAWQQGSSGRALAQALESLNWDPSVKSLVPFPQVVATLNSQLEWMQQLGYAFATQQADVMASVQRLRHQAQAAGTLTTTQQQRVAEENGTIAIEPASPQYRLRAGLQSDGRLWRLAKSGVSAGVYSAAGRLFAGQRGRWRICLWRPVW